ncbi:MAG: hydrogen peroxide-inducible genes activator [Sulfitobacter sp.]|nr:hydrogen peroxide-inducible genes activator [Sulfitobacter sp.]
MANFTLKQLRYFESLAAQGHFGRAAETCAISQPALSVQIRELEAQLGQPLFERGSRSVRLSAFGETVAPRVREILRGCDALGEMARSAEDDLTGPFRLGIIPTIAPYLVPRLIARLAHSHPGLDLHLRETLTPKLVAELASGQLDCALLALPLGEPGLTEMPLFEEEFLLVRPRAAEGQPVPALHDLAQERLLMLEEGHCFRDQVLAFCNAPRGGPQRGLEGSSLSTLVQMVGSGIGVTLIPQMAREVEERAAPVSCARFSGTRPKRRIGLAWRRASPLATQLQAIGEEVRACGPAPL